jgi:hypothetical protein
VDLELPLGEVTDDLERLCRHLEPTGMGNPGPVFGVRGVTFAGRGWWARGISGTAATRRAPGRDHRLSVGRSGPVAGR